MNNENIVMCLLYCLVILQCLERTISVTLLTACCLFLALVVYTDCIAEKCEANNQQEQSKAPLPVWYEIHTSAQPIQQLTCRTNNVAQQFSCLSLHSCRLSTAEKHGANNQQEGSPNCLVWNSHKCPANTATDLQNKQCRPTIQLPFAW
jgi:hypothetical protein